MNTKCLVGLQARSSIAQGNALWQARSSQQPQALQGRNQDVALAGLPLHNRAIFHRALPYAIDYKGNALSAMPISNPHTKLPLFHYFLNQI